LIPVLLMFFSQPYKLKLMRFSRLENRSRPLLILKWLFFMRFNDKCWSFVSELSLTLNYVNPGSLILLSSKFRLRLFRSSRHSNPADKWFTPALSISLSVNCNVRVLIYLSFLSWLERTFNSLPWKLLSHKLRCKHCKFERAEKVANN